MKPSEKTISLVSKHHYGRHAPAEAVGAILKQVSPMLRGAVLMAIQGRSRIKGSRPEWLSLASDIRFCEISGRDDTVLHFEVPTIGEAAPQFYEQKQIWPTLPPPESTAFEILSSMVKDINAGERDSDRFDKPILSEVAGFHRILNGEFQEVVIDGKLHGEMTKINATTVRVSKELEFEVPESREVMIVGRLDMIRHSTKGFEVCLDDGDRVRGVLLEGEMESLSLLFNREVLVRGLAFYRPSGKLLRVDAREISEGSSAPRIFSKVPPPLDRKSHTSALKIRQRPGTGVGAFFGTWPGDETDEELLEALKKVG